MCPDHMDIRPFDEEETEIVLQNTLQGPFHSPPIPADLHNAMSPTSYATPNSQAFPNLAIGSPGMWTAESSPHAAIYPYMMNEAGQHLPISQYTNCKADAGIDQVNGFVFVCDTGVQELQSPQGRYLYKDCTKYGAGSQVNGVEIVVHGSTRIAPAPPSLLGRWDDVHMLNAEGREVKGGYKSQFNGGRVRLMRRADMGGRPSGSGR